MFFYQEARDECKMTSTMWVIWQAAPSYEGLKRYTVGKEGGQHRFIFLLLYR